MTQDTAALASRLLALHRAPELLTVVNVWDVVSARVVADVPGTTALATASHSIAASAGYEDGENIPVDEMLAAIGRIVRATELPVSADLESGYGDPGGTPRAAEAEEQRAHSAEFRRYTENDLRAGKRENALAVIRTLDALSSASAGEGGAVLKLSPEESRQWLSALNDLRLAIGSRLEITDEDDSELLFRLPDEDPRKPMVMAYLWLGGLQETLVSTLMP